MEGCLGILTDHAANMTGGYMVKISGQQRFNLEKVELYQQLMDPDLLQKCIPGCKALNLTAPGKYEAELELGIAAVKGRYLGEVEIVDAFAPDGYTMHMSGSGGPGHVKASIQLRLEAVSGTETVLKYEGDADVGGKIAAVGQRMLGGVAKIITKQFFSAMFKEVDKKVS